MVEGTCLENKRLGNWSVSSNLTASAHDGNTQCESVGYFYCAEGCRESYKFMPTSVKTKSKAIMFLREG